MTSPNPGMEISIFALLTLGNNSKSVWLGRQSWFQASLISFLLHFHSSVISFMVFFKSYLTVFWHGMSSFRAFSTKADVSRSFHLQMSKEYFLKALWIYLKVCFVPMCTAKWFCKRLRVAALKPRLPGCVSWLCHLQATWPCKVI